MGVFTYEHETSSVIPPPKLFKAFILDGDNLVPKVAPQAIKSIEILEGHGGPGTVKKITFAEGSQYKYVKHKIEKIDEPNFSYSYSLIEGDALGDILEKISYKITIIAHEGGSIVKSISHYHTKGDHEIKEEHVKSGKEKAAGLFKAIEGYLVAHPDEYN